jgi:hypothetical protein
VIDELLRQQTATAPLRAGPAIALLADTVMSGYQHRHAALRFPLGYDGKVVNVAASSSAPRCQFAATNHAGVTVEVMDAQVKAVGLAMPKRRFAGRDPVYSL